jgi:hypothetical protein
MQRVCTGLGLNWETSPFIYVKPADKLILYATKDCAAQLRRRDGISIEVTGRSFMPEQGIYCVEVKATNAQGRSETAIGSVGVMGMKHETLAGQMMRAETKAKRRVTLSLCGLGLDGEDDIPAFSPIGNGSAKGDRTTDSLMAGNAAADGREAGAQPSAIKGLIVSDQQSASVSAATLAEAAPFVASPTAAASVMQTLSDNIAREAAKADQPPNRDIVDKAKEILSPLGFVVTDETASPAALDDEIEVLADELVALNDALGEKKTTMSPSSKSGDMESPTISSANACSSPTACVVIGSVERGASISGLWFALPAATVASIGTPRGAVVSCMEPETRIESGRCAMMRRSSASSLLREMPSATESDFSRAESNGKSPRTIFETLLWLIPSVSPSAA